jgi:hypothetical protein
LRSGQDRHRVIPQQRLGGAHDAGKIESATIGPPRETSLRAVAAPVPEAAPITTFVILPFPLHSQSLSRPHLARK